MYSGDPRIKLIYEHPLVDKHGHSGACVLGMSSVLLRTDCHNELLRFEKIEMLFCF